MYCQMIDYNKDWMQNHIKFDHDEHGKVIRLFICNQCNHTMIEFDILHHTLQHESGKPSYDKKDQIERLSVVYRDLTKEHQNT